MTLTLPKLNSNTQKPPACKISSHLVHWGLSYRHLLVQEPGLCSPPFSLIKLFIYYFLKYEEIFTAIRQKFSYDTISHMQCKAVYQYSKYVLLDRYSARLSNNSIIPLLGVGDLDIKIGHVHIHWCHSIHSTPTSSHNTLH